MQPRKYYDLHWMGLKDPVEILQKEIQTWDRPFVELDCFGTDSAERIVEMINKFCETHLGSGLRGYLFYGASIGSTHGVQLEDNRELVIKVRPPAETNPYLSLDRASLKSICQVMSWLSDRDYPCPKPVLGPTPLAKGLATVEHLLDAGELGNGFDPACRKIIASGFAELIGLLRSFEGTVSCLKHFQRSDSLYAQPHSKLFDFKRTAEGAEWIDAFAERARRAEAHGDNRVIGHADWRVEHLRFDDGRIVATYDWDSLAFCPETELVGISAHGFTADWLLEGIRRIPQPMTFAPMLRITKARAGSRFQSASEDRYLPRASIVSPMDRAARTRLSRAKLIGKKTAGRICFEQKERLFCVNQRADSGGPTVCGSHRWTPKANVETRRKHNG